MEQKYPRKVGHHLRKYVTDWSIAGTIIAATGAAPEHWLSETLKRAPHVPLPSWLHGVDFRLLAVVSGVGIIVADNVWRKHRRGRTVHAAPAAAMPHRPSIVVLPFKNLSGDPAQDYFASGM